MSTIANHDELTPDSEFTADLTAQVESREEGVEGVVDPTCTGQRRPPPMTRRRLNWPPPWLPCRSPTPCAASPSGGPGRCPRGGLLHLPPRRGWRAHRGPPRPQRPPDGGRRLNLWRLRDFDLTRPRGRPMSCCSGPGQGQRRRPAALRVGPGAPVQRRPRRGRQRCRPPASRARHRELSEGIRRARAAAGSGGARLDMNHVWLHVWPPVSADLDQLTALESRIAPMTAGAGIEELRIEGVWPEPAARSPRSSSSSAPCRAAASSRPSRSPPPSASHLSMGMPRRSSAPGGAAWSIPTNWCRWWPAVEARPSSTTSTRPGASSPWTGPTARTRQASSAASSPPRPACTPKA